MYYDDANEEALDMAVDMADRYGVAVEDAYMFALESKRYTPEMKNLREDGRYEAARLAHSEAGNRYRNARTPRERSRAERDCDIAGRAFANASRRSSAHINERPRDASARDKVFRMRGYYD